ncbi:MAG: hypothetical protein IIW86_04535 [Clostridia bacterium]|nr:hypothetical protein [Clostridia bacterium]
MQLTKPTLSVFAEDFELMKAKLSSDEIINILSGISDLCIFGETEYKPETKQQIYFWDKVKSKFDHDLSAYNASVNNGRMGGRPKKQKPKENPNNNPEKTQDITQRKPSSHLTLDTCQVNTCLKKTQSSDKSSDCAKKKKISFENVVDWESLFDYWEQNKKGGKYKNAESRNRQLAKLKELTNGDFEYAKQAIVFCIDNKYQGFYNGSSLFYRNVAAATASRKSADDDAEYWEDLARRLKIQEGAAQ